MSWVAAAVGAVGLGTSIYGKIKAGQEQRKLENAQSPVFTPSRGIADYYNKALSRYNLNPYQTPLYQQQLQMAQGSTAAGLNALQGRGAALAGVGGLVSGQNNTLLNAGAMAQEQQAQALAQLGGAAGANAGQQMQAFDINSMQPFVRNYNLLAMKAGGANQLANAGLQTFNSAANSYGQQLALKNYFGGQNSNTGSPNTNLDTNGSWMYGQQPGSALSPLQNPGINANAAIFQKSMLNPSQYDVNGNPVVQFPYPITR